MRRIQGLQGWFRMIPTALSFCLPALVTLVLTSIELQAESCEYGIQVWQIEDGLPQNSVTSIVQSPEGYLWLGTFNGLARFDGAKFTVFDEGNTPALQSSRLVRLDLDQHGGLWIITEEGALTRYWDHQFRSVPNQEGLSRAGTAAVVRGPHNRLLLVDRAGGVSWLRGEEWIPQRRYESLNGHRISLWTDPKDKLWVWFRDKRTLGWFDTDGFRFLPAPDGRQKAQVRAYAPSRVGGLWVVLANQVWHYDTSQDRWQPTDWVLPESARGLTHMLEDRHGTLWLGTYGSGLLHFQPAGKVECLTTAEGLSHDAVRALCEDREGNLWVGTDGGGLNRLRPRLVTTRDVRHGLTGQVVMSIVSDRLDTNTFWLGLNGGGVNCLRSGAAVPLVVEPVLGTNSFVYGLLSDRQGRLWVGSYDLGIFYYHGGELTCLPGTERWAGRPLLAAVEDRAGSVWLGGGFGLYQWRDGKMTAFNSQAGWSNVTVRALAEDRAGNLYVGSFGRGLQCYRQGQWTPFSEKDGLADNHVSALYVGGDDALWIGTFNGGLSRFKNNRFRNLTTRDGLPASSISSILEDNDANLWLGSNRGIIRIPKAQVTEFAEGQRQSVSAYVFDLADGLNTLECGGGAHPGACKAPDGRLWFATVKGLAVVDPAKLPFNPLPPPVVVEEVLVDEQSVVKDQRAIAVDQSSNLHLRAAQPRDSLDRPAGALATSYRPPLQDLEPSFSSESAILKIPCGKHRLEFRFTGLSLVAPEKVRFRYRLRGLDEQWVDGSSRRSASYSYLPPGKYRFEVTASNNNGVWNQSGAHVSVVVLPPWWRTWWVETGAVIGTVGLLYWLGELRLRRLRHERSLQAAFAQRLIGSQEEERQRMAAELHDGVGQSLLVIKNCAVLGLRATAGQRAAGEQFEEISQLVTQTIEGVREISRNLRPYQLDRLGLTQAVKTMAEAVSRSSGLPCALEIEPVDGLLALSSEIHLYRIIQELISNTVKHSDAAQAKIILKRQNARLVLTVEDDGRGFDYDATLARPAHEHGLGLKDVTERVGILGGSLRCGAWPGKGVRWQIEIPVRAESMSQDHMLMSAPS